MKSENAPFNSCGGKEHILENNQKHRKNLQFNLVVIRLSILLLSSWLPAQNSQCWCHYTNQLTSSQPYWEWLAGAWMESYRCVYSQHIQLVKKSVVRRTSHLILQNYRNYIDQSGICHRFIWGPHLQRWITWHLQHTRIITQHLLPNPLDVPFRRSKPFWNHEYRCQ